MYAGQDINGGLSLFSRDALIGISARGRIWGPIDLFFDFARRFRSENSEMPMANETGGGIGISITY